MNPAAGRGFNSHNEVWQPEMMNIEVDESEIYPRGLLFYFLLLT